MNSKALNASLIQSYMIEGTSPYRSKSRASLEASLDIKGYEEVWKTLLPSWQSLDYLDAVLANSGCPDLQPALGQGESQSGAYFQERP